MSATPNPQPLRAMIHDGPPLPGMRKPSVRRVVTSDREAFYLPLLGMDVLFALEDIAQQLDMLQEALPLRSGRWGVVDKAIDSVAQEICRGLVNSLSTEIKGDPC